MTAPRAQPGVEAPAYAVPRARAPVDLRLDANEGARPDPDLLAAIPDLVDAVGAYPSTAALEAKIAASIGVAPDRVLVTAGADDALDRACRAVLGPECRAVLPEPGFAMLRRYVELAQATPVSVAWPEGAFPTQAVIDASTPDARLIAITSPNNPTGAVATAADVVRVARSAPQAVVLVDLAYGEFADEDLTQVALGEPNAIVARTLSKAWGLAGIRVGYVVGSTRIIGWLRSIGLPYAVSGLSLALASRALDRPERMAGFVAQVRAHREVLTTALLECGARPQASQANFVLARVRDPIAWRDGFAGLGIGIRAFPDVSRLEDAIRISVPGEPDDLARVARALQTLAWPSRILTSASLAWPGVTRVRDLAGALNPKEGSGAERPPTWVVAQRADEVQIAREAGALPLGLFDDALIDVGAARTVTSEGDLAAFRAAFVGGGA